MMDPISQLAEILQIYGSWGMCAVFLLALFFIWRAYVNVRDRHDDATGQQLKGAIELVEECTRAAVEQRNALVNLTRALESLERRLENVEKTVG